MTYIIPRPRAVRRGGLRTTFVINRPPATFRERARIAVAKASEFRLGKQAGRGTGQDAAEVDAQIAVSVGRRRERLVACRERQLMITALGDGRAVVVVRIVSIVIVVVAECRRWRRTVIGKSRE